MALVSAAGVVLTRRPIRAVVALLAHSLAIAALYALLSAGMVAVGQMLIYSGAIVVLFLFVVTLLPTGGAEVRRPRHGVVIGLVAAILLAALLSTLGNTHIEISTATVGAVVDIGHQLFDADKLLVPFELTAPLLLVAIIGSVAVWRRQGTSA